MAPVCLLATVADDPHTQGLFRVARLAREAGITAHVLPPGTPAEVLLERVRALDPEFLGLSYRLSPEVGLRELTGILGRLHEAGLLRRAGAGPRKVAVAGLPETMQRIEAQRAALPCPVHTMAQDTDRVRSARRVLGFLEVPEARQAEVLARLAAEYAPPRIALLDELAREVAAGDDYRNEPPLPVPSEAARASYVRRIEESDLPLLRSHYGVPAPTIQPTVEGIERLAAARVLDEVSLGSSDLSQRFFGHPEAFEGRKNDGGVPYRTFEDLVALAGAARRGNFPGVKPYAHVVDLVPFVETCLRAGMLRGAHQAVPLFWFNELDGRGPHTVAESLREHQATVRALAAHGLPVEMNDPNHWSSRWAHDTIIAVDYALITAVMLQAGVRDLVLQLQFQKPRETGDYADLAKMTASLELAGELLPPGGAHRIWREVRTGIDSFDPDLGVARHQLARATLLQLYVEPSIIHLVSYCEAIHVAGDEDIVDSSRLVRRAVRVFRRHRDALREALDTGEVRERRAHLVAEARVLLRAIAELAPGGPVPEKTPLRTLGPRLADPEALHQALSRGLLAAPGIFHPGYPAARGVATGVLAHGGLDALDPETAQPLREAHRLARLRDLPQAG